MIKYKIDILKELKSSGYTQRYLLDNNIFSGGTLTAIRHQSNHITLLTIDKVCRLLDCHVFDIIEYIP